MYHIDGQHSARWFKNCVWETFHADNTVRQVISSLREITQAQGTGKHGQPQYVDPWKEEGSFKNYNYQPITGERLAAVTARHHN